MSLSICPHGRRIQFHQSECPQCRAENDAYEAADAAREAAAELKEQTEIMRRREAEKSKIGEEEKRYCTHCRIWLTEPSTFSISAYANFWRGICPKCSSPLLSKQFLPL